MSNHRPHRRHGAVRSSQMEYAIGAMALVTYATYTFCPCTKPHVRHFLIHLYGNSDKIIATSPTAESSPLRHNIESMLSCQFGGDYAAHLGN